ncbi:MAG: hypothetical protein KDH86_12780, partial [Anaerolineae bacterium]|nr:hypothetical protein [Anaerolineae bacterium]
DRRRKRVQHAQRNLGDQQDDQRAFHGRHVTRIEAQDPQSFGGLPVLASHWCNEYLGRIANLW